MRKKENKNIWSQKVRQQSGMTQLSSDRIKEKNGFHQMPLKLSKGVIKLGQMCRKMTVECCSGPASVGWAGGSVRALHRAVLQRINASTISPW